MTTNMVLVVEDEPIIRMVAVEMLEEAGWSVVAFATADEAVAFWGQSANDIAAVFTDINMPGNLDGLDLAALVATSRPTVAIIVTSGRYRAPPAELANRIRFLPKPWDSHSLLAAVGENTLKQHSGDAVHNRDYPHSTGQKAVSNPPAHET